MIHLSILWGERVIIKSPLQPLRRLFILLIFCQAGIIEELKSHAVCKLHEFRYLSWAILVLLAFLKGVRVNRIIIKVNREYGGYDFHFFWRIFWTWKEYLRRVELDLRVVMAICAHLGWEIFVDNVLYEGRNLRAFLDLRGLLHLQVSQVRIETLFHNSFLNRVVLEVRLFNLNGERCVSELFLPVTLWEFLRWSQDCHLVYYRAGIECHLLNLLEEVKSHETIDQNADETSKAWANRIFTIYSPRSCWDAVRVTAF